MTPDENFWDWIYGEHLHDDPTWRVRLEAWAPVGAHKFNCLKMASDFAKIYYAFSGIVREVLAEPDLCPPHG